MGQPCRNKPVASDLAKITQVLLTGSGSSSISKDNSPTSSIDKDKRSENIKRYMQLIVEEFLDTYYNSHVIGFKGDLSPFHEFETVIDQYFEI